MPKKPSDTKAKEFYEGMGQAVAKRTILRKKPDGQWESWGDVAERVAKGSSLLHPVESGQVAEKEELEYFIRKAMILMSGRHLQHGDANQLEKNLEVFTNCSTAATSFLSFYLLLNGSGVGRSYDDSAIVVDWSYAPKLVCAMDESHPDFSDSAAMGLRDCLHMYGHGEDVIYHKVDDSREGWALALEKWETLTYQRTHKEKLLVIDFSDVRSKGSPIKGLQNRPASGPNPVIEAFNSARALCSSTVAPWKQAMYIDHLFADCVRVGGARRSARIATKYWGDPSVVEFCKIKRPIEFEGKTIEQIASIRENYAPSTFLYSSNNSVMVDREFWAALESDEDSPSNRHAQKVFRIMSESSYIDGTGEPGFINVDQLASNGSGLDEQQDPINSKRLAISPDGMTFLKATRKKLDQNKYKMIVNPCGEIALSAYGGFCVIADTVPYFADNLEEAEQAFRAVTRALIRTNLMGSIYDSEVKRTNRIGVGITGVHEFAYKFFGFGFDDLVDEEKSLPFWQTLAHFSRAVRDEAEKYCKLLGVNVPHTALTVKPAGTTSKLFGLTEGWHLCSKPFYLRWVQFRDDDPSIRQYEEQGYPIKRLVSYSNTIIVGFPTLLRIAKLGMGQKLVSALDASMEDQYKWLQLGEKYWLNGFDGKTEYTEQANQISYTLKYDPSVVGLAAYQTNLKLFQSKVKACSVMPTENLTSYEYLPEQSITEEQYQEFINKLSLNDNDKQRKEESFSLEHVSCGVGGCPIDLRPQKEND